MFKEINDRINLSFDSHIPKGKEEIIASLRRKAAGQSAFSFFLPGQVDFKEFKFVDGEIEILRKPGTFSAFRPFGKIRITFTETDSSMTKVRCDVMTGNNSIPFLMTIQTFVLVIWSIGWIIMGRNLDALTRYLTPIAVLILINTISYVKYRGDKQSLIDYSRTVIKTIRD